MKMSRRKQARPSRHLDEEEDQENALLLEPDRIPNRGNNKGLSGEEESSPHVCCHCRVEVSSLVELVEHQKDCSSKFEICNGDQSEPEDVVSYGDDDFGSEGDKRQEVVRRQKQDAENNNSVEEGEKGNDLPLGFPFSVSGVPGHVTLEALQNTKVAVAQFAASALAANGDNPAAMQELAVLQSTLFTLQQQQMMQLSLIQQLQNHLTVHPKEESPASPPPSSNPSTNPGILVPAAPPIQQVSNKPLRIPTPVNQKSDRSSVSPPASQSVPATHKQQSFDHQPLTIPKPPVPLGSPLQSNPPTSTHPPLGSISSSLASSIITNNDPPPSLNEPNTLEMLQKRAQEVLENASQGLLANNLADELAFRKNGKNSLSPLSGGRNEPFFKHRCRYCGKVFGSDSALQIHIRSHTGERPFKCNVCGSRFTTKGNLKVHFQRHTSKFPHIKMNPNPVPEHLDKYHPPLLAQINNQTLAPQQNHSHPHRPSPHYPFATSPPFPSPALPLFRPPLPHDLLSRPSTVLPPLRPHDSNLLKPLIPLPMFTARDEQDTPENLSKPQNRGPPSPEPDDPQEQPKTRSRTPSPVVISQEPLGRTSADDVTVKTEAFEEGGRHSSIEKTCKLRSSGTDKGLVSERAKDCPSEEEDVETNLDENQKERLSPNRKVQSECEEKTDLDHGGVFTRSPHFDECSVDSKYSDDDVLEDNFEERNPGDADKMDDQPENLSSKSPTMGQVSEVSSQRTMVKTIPFPNAVSPHSSNSSGSNNFSVHIGAGSNSQEIDPAKDPAIYNSLLPRPGSNDNSWESLIEVTKTSETYKLQQLVDNIEHKLTDPNQCVICHRVLSCKSALQMHYRTHTGERPFRCKICGRAFTTKGNLKTHMGVHRLKPPMRVLHQCPVCHKKFTNALVLQQHIRLHTGEPTDLTPEQIHAAEIKDFASSAPFTHPNFLAQGFPMSGVPPPGLHLGVRPEFDRDLDSKDDHPEEDIYDEDDDDFSNSSESQPLHFPSFSSSISAIENQVRTITTMASQFPPTESTRSAEDLSLNKISSPTFRVNGVKSPVSPDLVSPNDSDFRPSPSPPTAKDQTPLSIPRPASSRTPSSPPNSDSNSPGALDLTPRSGTLRSSPVPPTTGIFSSLGLIPAGGPSPLITSALSSLTSSVLTSTAFSPLGMAVGPAVRGNTTCNICFKTFACNSALEIHYRSHTKERPFKCTICDRGFSTKNDPKAEWCRHQWRNRDKKLQYTENRKKSNEGLYGLPHARYATDRMHPGNMKQHMLTHKIRDMPGHLFENKKSPPFGAQQQGSGPNQNEEISEVSNLSNSNSVGGDDSKMATVEVPESPPVSAESEPSAPIKRTPTELDLPVPKRQPNMPKHLCHVCNKNFSSSSALQIHMRTHTGDKPFRCTVCQKAFTTKGNLKVHMGTHMWSNGASRRGRRMSLDLPPIPMNPKDSEFLQRRPDLFYPYLPTPFLNGVQQKLNEMSVLQTGNHQPNNGLIQAGTKFGGLVGFGSFGNVEKSHRPNSRSPPLEKSTSPEEDSRSQAPGEDASREVWDPYFERKISHSEEAMRVTPPSTTGGNALSAQRGEGLAA